MIVEIAVSVLLLAGAGFTLLGSIGLARLPDFLMRLHGPTKATTLGVGAIVLASVLHGGPGAGGVGELAITLFLFITAPITAHLLGKAALAERRRRAAGGEEVPPQR